MRAIGVVFWWLWGGWRWFSLGHCPWCKSFQMILRSEGLCEDCWLSSK